MSKYPGIREPSVATRSIWTVDAAGSRRRSDLLAVESPLEIRLGYGKDQDRKQKSISITMRTPGNDLELAVGFLFTEGILRGREDLLSVRHCEDSGKKESKGNVLRVELVEQCEVDLGKLQRHFYTSSSCGVCGKSSIEAIRNIYCTVLEPRPNMIASDTIHKLSAKLRDAQKIFTYTGGLHAAAFFSSTGDLLRLREDVGRHNALDKLIGTTFFEQSENREKILFLSGRISFELVQKALAAEVPIIVAVGAPSSLAVELAEESGITLVGFSRNQSFNLYTHPQRIKITNCT